MRTSAGGCALPFVKLASLSPSILYDARTSLDKLRLASTRFVGSTPPSPYAAFAESTRREHILVTGGFTALGRALVRDLLLLGENNGADEAARQTSLKDQLGLADWWRNGPVPAEDDDSRDQAARLAKSLEGKRGIIVTILDTDDRSAELDDMLKHAPLYHRSRTGFNLPVEGMGILNYGDGDFPGRRPGLKADSATPPLEFIDPRSAAFSSSQVSLATFIAKGRLRLVKGDVRNTTLLTSLLNPHYGVDNPSAQAVKAKSAKDRFGVPKRPHHDADEGKARVPVSGVFHLAGHLNSACKRLNPRDCADLERNGVASLTAALRATIESLRPWVVLGDRGNLESEEVNTWLADNETPSPALSAETRLPGAANIHTVTQAARRRTLDRRRKQSHARRDYFTLSDYASPLAGIAREQKLHAIALRLPPDNHIFGDSFASRTEAPIARLVQSAVGHLPVIVGEDTFPNAHVPSAISGISDPAAVAGTERDDETSNVWQTSGLVYIEDVVETMLAAGELLARSNSAEYLRKLSIIAEVDVVPPQGLSASVPGPDSQQEVAGSIAQEAVNWVLQLTKSSSSTAFLRKASSLSGEQELRGKRIDRALARRLLGTVPSTPLPLALKAYIRSLLGRQTTYLDSQIGKACAPPPDLRALNDALANMHMCTVQLLGLVSTENIVLACNSQYLADRTQPPLLLREPYSNGLSQIKLKARWGPTGRVDVGFFCPFGRDGADEQIFWTESTKEVVGRWATASDVERISAEDATLWTYDKFEVNFIRRDTRSFTISIPQYPQANLDSPKRRMVFTVDHSRKGTRGGMKEMMILNWQLLAETGADWQTMEWRLNPISCTRKDFVTPKGFTFLDEDRESKFSPASFPADFSCFASAVYVANLIPYCGRNHNCCRVNIRNPALSRLSIRPRVHSEIERME